MKWIYPATVLDSLTSGLFSSRTGILQALLDRPCGLLAAHTQPVLSLPEKNFRPLFSLLRLMLLGDEIAYQKTDCYRAQKNYEEIIFQMLFPTAHCARNLALFSIARMSSGGEFLIS